MTPNRILDMGGWSIAATSRAERITALQIWMALFETWWRALPKVQWTIVGLHRNGGVIEAR